MGRNMEKICAGARALALLVAIVAAFVTVPQVATVLLVLGALSALANRPEDNIRVYLVATVFTVAAKNLAGFVAVGAYLSAIFGNVAVAATGAAALAAVLAIVRMTQSAFSGSGQTALKAATAS
jgi:hypothetical protein